MNKITASALAALMAVSAVIPATTQPAEARRRGAAIVGGVILGAAALAIIANSNRARADDGDYTPRRSNWQIRCDNWYNRCQNGSDWACEKFETKGCSE
jgi:hypothetical protein